MSDATEKAIDVAADVAGEVADQAEQMQQFIRSMNKAKVQYGLLGAAIGAAAGAMMGFAIAYRKAERKYAKIADEEIAEMRQHYQDKALAAEATAAKVDLEGLVTERGYKSEAPPMVVAPPTEIVTAGNEAEKDIDTPENRQEVIENLEPPPETRNVFKEAEVDDVWDYHEERARRSPTAPYVIHYDERHEFEGYSEMTLTYYEADDVLCNERDEVIGPEDRNQLVGEKSLLLFGHGSNDAAIVFVRNDKLELVFEIVQSPNSYAMEVHGLDGFTHDSRYHRNLERMRTRERDEPDDD